MTHLDSTMRPRYQPHLCALLIAVASAMWPSPLSAAEPPAALDIEQVGFRGVYKVGHWTPVWLRVDATESAGSESLDVTTSDNDGLAMTVRATVLPRDQSQLVYTKIGRVGAVIHATLTAEGKTLERHSVQPGDLLAGTTVVRPLRSTSELVVQVGRAPLGLSEALPDREPQEGNLGRRVVQLERIEELPTDARGYDAVDLLVLACNDLPLAQKLAADGRRLAAIEAWVALGGRLVVVCGPQTTELIASGRPLARFVPGEFVDVVQLTETRGLENFAAIDKPIRTGSRPARIVVPRLVNPTGSVEVYGRASDVPLVIHAPRGFGEVTFVGVDLTAEPLADWAGRSAFLQAVVRPYIADLDVESSAALVSLGYDDLAGAIRQRLGRSFFLVMPVAFSIVATLAIGYLLLLGPLDYFLVHKLLRRPWVAWVTFPLLIVVVSGGVLALGSFVRGTGPLQVNQAELVDVDLETGLVRGTLWASLYSPDARQFDLEFEPRLPGNRPAAGSESHLSWLGLPGTGLGGMHARGMEIDMTLIGYQLSAAGDRLLQLPVLTSSTKSITARWNATDEPQLAADLAVDRDGLLVGSLTNQTSETLHDAYLLYGQWGYRLGDLAPAQPRAVDAQLNPVQAKTLLARLAGRADRGDYSGEGRAVFSVDGASTEQLLHVMMFYQAVGGRSFAGMSSRFQSHCDLSRLLALGRAVLVARAAGSGSHFVDQQTDQTLSAPRQDTSVFYRFVIPIGER